MNVKFRYFVTIKLYYTESQLLNLYETCIWHREYGLVDITSQWRFAEYNNSIFDVTRQSHKLDRYTPIREYCLWLRYNRTVLHEPNLAYIRNKRQLLFPGIYLSTVLLHVAWRGRKQHKILTSLRCEYIIEIRYCFRV